MKRGRQSKRCIGMEQIMGEKSKIKYLPKMIAPLLLLLLFGVILLGFGFRADAAGVGYITSVTGPNYQYAVGNKNLTELAYGTETGEYIYGYSDIATLPDGGKSVSVNTGNDKDKNFKLCYKELQVVVSVPANTTYTVVFDTTLKGTFEVSNKKATAKYSCQLVYLGEKSADDTVKFYPGATPKITVDGVEGNTNVQGYYIDPDKKSTTYTCGDDTTQTEVTCHFVNNTDKKKDITHHFGLWVSCDYGSKYSNRGTATFTIKSKSVSYTLNFDPNGGALGTTNKAVTVGGTYGTLPTPTRTGGYTFDGWYTKNGKKITADSKVYDVESYGNTLYAHWSLTPAVPPVIDKLNTDITVTYGKSPATGLTCHGESYHTLSQEWYECDENGNNGKLLTDENGKPTYIRMPPAGVNYYYCLVIGTRSDNGLSASTKSAVMKVTVEKATPSFANGVLSASKVDLAVNKTLSESILTGGEMRISYWNGRLVVPGTFSWVDGTIKLEKPQSGRGAYYEVIFTPDDTDNYNAVILEEKVWVEITCSHGDKWGAWQEDGTRTCTACRRTETGRISVTVTWGAMEFTYYDGDWDPETHEFEYGYWAPDAEDGDSITVKNTGTVPVNVEFTYSQSDTDTAVSADFDDGTAPVTASVALPVGEEKKIRLTLSGKPGGEMAGATLGRVTVKIGGVLSE